MSPTNGSGGGKSLGSWNGNLDSRSPEGVPFEDEIDDFREPRLGKAGGTSKASMKWGGGLFGDSEQETV